jgi:hypothetical protein
MNELESLQARIRVLIGAMQTIVVAKSLPFVCEVALQAIMNDEIAARPHSLIERGMD